MNHTAAPQTGSFRCPDGLVNNPGETLLYLELITPTRRPRTLTLAHSSRSKTRGG